MPRPDHHIFVCMQVRPPGHPRSSCGGKGCEPVYNEFMQQVVKRNLQNVSITQTGCLGPCQAGANILIYPAGTMYSWVEPEDVEKILDHMLAGTLYADKIPPAEVW